MTRAVVISTLAILITATVTLNSSPADPVLNDSASARLDSFVQAMMTCRKVTALSLTLVHGDRTRARAYGLADVERGIPATSKTGFPIGSVTKQFTTTLLASLLTEHKDRYTWDSKIKDIIGDDFRFIDAIRTEHATIRDLAAHKMGVMSYDLPLAVGFDQGHSRLDYCRRVYTLQTMAGFRSRFGYSNMVYMLLGCVAEKLGNDTYGNLLRTRIFEPLGMNSTGLVTNVTNWTAPDMAHSYVCAKDRLYQLDPILLNRCLPAEAACVVYSNAEDMAKWIMFHADSLSGTSSSLADLSILSVSYQPQMAIPTGPLHPPNVLWSEYTSAYTMGWMTGAYREKTGVNSRSDVLTAVAAYDSNRLQQHLFKNSFPRMERSDLPLAYMTS